MIPLYECAGKYEALRLERKLVKRWKPSLNQGDRPFWLLKQAYATDFRSGRNQQRDRKPPWTRHLKLSSEVQSKRRVYMGHPSDTRIVT